jgi:uncharacterized membrane protein
VVKFDRSMFCVLLRMITVATGYTPRQPLLFTHDSVGNGAVVTLLAFRTPWQTLAVAGAKGVWDAIFILYVFWPALLLYQVTKQAGAYDALRQGIARFSRNELFIILALSWVFASFLQGIAGFGAPIAIVVPLLLAHIIGPPDEMKTGESGADGLGLREESEANESSLTYSL